MIESQPFHQREQQRLRAASSCNACKALWDTFTNDFCTVHEAEGWHSVQDEPPPVPLVALEPIRLELGLSIAERDDVLYRIGVSLSFRDGQLMVTPSEAVLIREEVARKRQQAEARAASRSLAVDSVAEGVGSVPDRSRPAKAEPSFPAYLRQHLNKDGSPKKTYETSQLAAMAASRLGNLDDGRVNFYHCPICSKWHVGHQG